MKKINSILIVALLLVGAVSAASFVSVEAQAPGDPFVAVGWQVVDEFEEISHSDQSSDWMFGPQPTITIEYAENGTDIAENHYQVGVGDLLFIDITIPKAFLGVDVDLDTVKFWGSGQDTSRAIFVLEYNATADVWLAPVTLHYQPGATEPSLTNFLSSSLENNSYEEATDFYNVVFAVTFTEPVIEGVFWTGMQTIDELGRPVSPSWLSRLQSGEYVTPPIALGVAMNPRDFSLPDYFYGDIVDEAGDLMHYASHNDTFIVRIMAGKELGDVVIPFAFLTQDKEYKQPFSYSQPMNWPGQNMDNPTPTWEVKTQPGGIAPMVYFEHNSTGTYALAGYPHIEFYWEPNPYSPDEGMWLLNFTMIYNSTVPLEDFYVQDGDLTKEFNAGNAVQWGGYFTNITDMDPGYGQGAVINTGDMLWWTVVEDANGELLTPSPEIQVKQTMKLAYKADYVEGFIFDTDGFIEDIASQEQELNFTFIVHKPEETLNGSLEVLNDGNLYQITTQLGNVSLQFSGHGAGENDTHYWQYAASYNMTLDFIANESRVWSVFVKATYEKPDYTPVGDVEITIDEWIQVHDFDIDIGPEQSTLYVNWSFHADAPDMLFDDVKMTVSQIENIRLWSGGDWIIWVGTEHWAYPTIVNNTMLRDLTGDILWSPSIFRLGEVDMFVPQVWSVTDEGAIDLDGNTFTTDDQYFVKRTGYWEDWGNISVEGMHVAVAFDPTPGNDSDEFFSSSWMGVVEMVMEFNANETYYWYHADDFTPVNSSEMSEIKDMMWSDVSEDLPAPEYSYVAWLSRNWTIELTQIPGLESGVWSNAWFAWGTQQAFEVATTNSSRTWATFRAEYAGMLIFNDDPEGISPNAPDFSIEEGAVETEEVTHIVLIDSIESLEIRQPFGATNGTDPQMVTVDTETPVEFGISIYDVNVTIYPLQIENGEGIRGPWQFRQSYEGALGLNSTNFDYWISHATIDEMSFDVSFSVDMVEYDADDPTKWNHATAFKIDQVIGNWTMHDFSNNVLEDRSLAVNYFAVLATATRTQYQAGDAPVTDLNGDSTGADYYTFGSENSPYANVSMGGLPYYWGGDDFTTEYISGSSTAPIGAFSLMLQSDSGQSVTRWNVDATMLFMTAGYANWGGYAVHVDPVFVSYSSAHQTPLSGTTTTTTGTTPVTTPTTTTPTVPPPDGDIGTLVLVGGTIAVVVILCVLARRRE